MDSKLKHLEFIQNVITRMNTNSFLLKGWTVTLVSALCALAAKDGNIAFVFIAYIPIPVFWGLDAFFLSCEREYRELYNKVRVIEEDSTDFSMNTNSPSGGFMSWLESFISKTLFPFYGILLVITFALIYFLK